MTGNQLYSTLHGIVEAERLQPIVSKHRNPGLIYIPPGTWEGSLIVAQHNLTLVGAGDETVIVGERGEPAITVNAPNVRILNLSVRTEYAYPAISFTDGDAPQGIIQNVKVLESGAYGVFRDGDYSSPINAIIDCHFENVAGSAICAESGAGPQNLIQGNTGESIGDEFIKWGVNAS
ncbi:MAG: hypothetical protein ABEI52_00835, partial [Halobacteriaceae archaeon]